MEDDIKIIEKQIGITDPFPFLFREIDCIHGEIKELRKKSKNEVQTSPDFQNQLNRIEYKIEETYRRMDWLFILGLVNFLALLLLLVKIIFF